MSAVDFVSLDSTDHRIIGILQRDARISWQALAVEVHLSASAAAERVRRMERSGAIEGYAARVDPAAIGRPLRAVVDVSLPPGGEPEAFESRLTQRPEVVFAAFVTGAADYEVVVDCAGPEGLDAFIRWLKSEGGAARTESKVVLRRVVG